MNTSNITFTILLFPVYRVFCNSYRVPLPLRTIKENSLIGGKFQVCQI